MLNAKDNRNSQVFESLALLDQPAQPAVSDKERKKFEDEKSKLYMQMDEKVWGLKKKPFLYRLAVNPKHLLARRHQRHKFAYLILSFFSIFCTFCNHSSPIQDMKGLVCSFNLQTAHNIPG